MDPSIRGGIAALISDGPDEPLNLELFNGIRLDRKPGERYIEIGRYVLEKGAPRELSPRLVQQISAALAGFDGDATIVIEAEKARARLFSRYGFKSVLERVNYAGEEEHVLAVSARELLSRVIEEDFGGTGLPAAFR